MGGSGGSHRRAWRRCGGGDSRRDKSGGHAQAGSGGGAAPGPHRSPGSQPFPGARGHAAAAAQRAGQCYSVLDGRHDYEIAMELLATRRVPLKDMVTHSFALSEMQEALRTAGDKRTGAIKVQVLP